MFYAITTLTLALVGTVRGTPLAVTSSVIPILHHVDMTPGSFPILDLSLNNGHQNTTVGANSVHSDAAGATFPAMLLLCRGAGCTRCSAFDLSTAPHKVCLTPDPPFNFISAGISQPSDEGLPFGVFVGPTCSSFAQIPAVNNCYNLNFVGMDFASSP